MPTPCVLCSPTLGPVIAQEAHWTVVLNRNQNLLGKLMLVLRHHAEAVPDLRPEEWAELHVVLGRATGALGNVFAPDHFNYAFLQNQDRHIHLHVIPRYSGPRKFGGQTFTDPDYPAHYAVPAPVRPLTPKDSEALTEQLQRAYAGAAS
ncbi:HIT family protein [Deinococcus budaensis]|uniref:Diadenosine tetraphosphate (Ap4A) HIT family hydrolase n=1 Tax=Deinococcus budaensis TaxID=1665626 RepID=A0A7W8GD28_9DEIO|nr:HIT family protein [Deinococcus budaensis]MBB5233342.1 diadenosine tetraphosphate (Ap4A) HIT family hydrolase [Deinococcus budaensis]